METESNELTMQSDWLLCQSITNAMKLKDVKVNQCAPPGVSVAHHRIIEHQIKTEFELLIM